MINEIKPQPGYQENALTTEADIAIGGGSAGAGKTFSLLLEPLRHSQVKGFDAVFFRRTIPQITNPGGLWDESANLYSLINPGPKPNTSSKYWSFPSGAKVKFSSLEHEKNKFDHQGAQYCLVCFDELTHFTESQFWYLVSRNRSTCGVRPYVRATCNPDANSWVKKLIGWWINDDGYPIIERGGVLRYFLKDGDSMIWGDTKEEVIEQSHHILSNFKRDIWPDLIKSLTFIPGSIHENKILNKIDPGYMGNLLAQEEEEKLRLLDGNWNATLDGLGMVDLEALDDIFSNNAERGRGYITKDVARFGRDFDVTMKWDGWQCTRIDIIPKDDLKVSRAVVEKNRGAIPKRRVLVDQDGVGGGVVDEGGYKGFSGGLPSLQDPKTKIKEYYKNQVTQMYYRFCERINQDQIGITDSEIYVDGRQQDWVMVGKQRRRVTDLIIEDFKAARKKDIDKDGKKQMLNKIEKAHLLNGRKSPDFSDCAVLREWFEFQPSGMVRSGKI